MDHRYMHDKCPVCLDPWCAGCEESDDVSLYDCVDDEDGDMDLDGDLEDYEDSSWYEYYI